MLTNVTKFGPGVFTLTPEAVEPGQGELELSCQLVGLVVSWAKETGDSLRFLCGNESPGGSVYSASLKGTLGQDLSDQKGITAFSWRHKGAQVQFTFTPSTADVATVTGTLTVDPLSIGADSYGANLTSEFEWACVGEPELGWPGENPGGGTVTATVTKEV